MNRKNPAPGAPGIEPHWTAGAKDAVGTAYAVSSRLWYTLARGVNTEIYYPTIDTPQVRDIQYMISDGETFFHDERRNTISTVELLDPDALGFKITNTDPEGRYVIEKQIIGDPHLNCLLIHTKFMPAPQWQGRLHLYVICAPHLRSAVGTTTAKRFSSEAGASSPPTATMSTLRWERATDFPSFPAVTLAPPTAGPTSRTISTWTGSTTARWTATSRSPARSISTWATNLPSVSPSVAAATAPAPPCSSRYAFPLQQISRASLISGTVRAGGSRILDMNRGKISDAASSIFARSINLLLAHEDKLYPGAMIASLSIPWGEDKGDDELGGYHLVWTRDMVHAAGALMAAGDTATPLRAMIYLAIAQGEDGGFFQNFWIDGRPYWTGVQLDEVSFPIILAWRLWKANALGEFDPHITVVRACSYLIRKGPATREERWEENGGYSPSTLASNIAALICAGEMLEARGDHSYRRLRPHLRRLPGIARREMDRHQSRLVAARREAALHSHQSRRQPGRRGWRRRS